MKVSTLPKLLATALIMLLPATLAPVNAQGSLATLTGSIVHGADATPMTGATLHAGDARSGRVFRSSPADDGGNFALGDLPPSTYRLAVESDGGLYVVEAPLTVAPGTASTLMLSVHPSADGADTLDDDDDSDDRFALLDNPLGAAMTFLGLAVIVGVIIGGSSGSSTGASSPSQPQG